jgi:hypothetical protein
MRENFDFLCPYCDNLVRMELRHKHENKLDFDSWWGHCEHCNLSFSMSGWGLPLVEVGWPLVRVR